MCLIKSLFFPFAHGLHRYNLSGFSEEQGGRFASTYRKLKDVIKKGEISGDVWILSGVENRQSLSCSQ